MATPREGPNPLRPYYVPPSIGVPLNVAPNATAPGVTGVGAGSTSSFSFPNLDYSDYISDASPSLAASAKTLLDKAVWKYTTVLLAQPFEVAKLILQVYVAEDDETGGRVVAESRRREGLSSMERSYAEEEEDDDEEEEHSSDDEPNFFTTSTPFADSPSSRSPRRGRQGRPLRHVTDRAGYIPSDHSASSPHRIQVKNAHSLLDALSALSANSGAFSLWRATNTTFLYSLLSRTTETFLRGLLAAIFGIAEADILVPPSTGAIPSSSILTSTAPLASVLIATASAAITSLLLSPIDASRTRLILTPSSRPPRTLWATLRTLSPSYLIPTHLIPITFLTSTLPTLISTSSPLFLKNNLNLDPILNPNSWNIATFVASTIDLAVRLPLETVLRRAQIATWTSPKLSPPLSSSSRKAFETIVPVPQVYRGIVPTMYSIIREEGTSSSPTDKAAGALGKPPRRRKGQGVQGLYRGWRLGLWSLVGVWGAGFIGGLQGGAESATEGVAAHAGKF